MKNIISKPFELTQSFEETAKELLSNAELLLVLETIEANPWAGASVEIDSQEFGGRIKFIQYPLDGNQKSRKGHLIKVMYAVFDEGDRIILMFVTTEPRWQRWLRNVTMKDVLIEGFKTIARRIVVGA